MSMRIAVAVLVFMFALNGFSWLMIESGTADFYGINAETGGVDCQEDICIEDPDEQQDTEFNTGASSGDTLFGQITTVSTQLNNLLGSIMPALQMFERLGVHPLIVTFIGSILGVITVIALAFFIRGY